MIKIYMCEDDITQLECIEKKIKQYIEMTERNAKIVLATKEPQQILELLDQDNQNQWLFFIDVQLDCCRIDGFGLAKEIRRRFPKSYLVFLTAKEEMAYQVFEKNLEVLDYIVKRPSFFLKENIDEGLMERLDIIFSKIECLQDEEKKKKIVVECGSRIIEIAIEDILYIQVMKVERMAEICCVEQKIMVRQSLRSLYEKMGKKFIYINKSCIVQKSKIQSIDKKNHLLTLKNGSKIEISFREMKAVVKMFQEKK